jgi:hypothetical protein
MTRLDRILVATLILLMLAVIIRPQAVEPAAKVRVNEVAGLNQRIIDIVESCVIEGSGTSYAHLSCEAARRHLPRD